MQVTESRVNYRKYQIELNGSVERYDVFITAGIRHSTMRRRCAEPNGPYVLRPMSSQRQRAPRIDDIALRSPIVTLTNFDQLLNNAFFPGPIGLPS